MVNNRFLRSKGNPDPKVCFTNQDKQNLFRVKHSTPINHESFISLIGLMWTIEISFLVKICQKQISTDEDSFTNEERNTRSNGAIQTSYSDLQTIQVNQRRQQLD